ncbi:carboxyphosphonoenolpyruvate phosphonomutase-like protein [Talaromyces stipitatus ATCC 10500]|uniref:Carboxyphosphonoenolpyruvate phosphonomutase-like protein n=1 Tax=Talaromyces stipitatus (strain ATCC 10500 / CBS 375.48 / QM 6759 / NRRL 1006) TaxID=441959 RepID=B8LV08_TALSN|nr:carboxyphosphonoenolpyruvate phosphonomutase-like protein [Talaromyces stipitatus ATCC 10500]EED22629.1 carboxyphosphonoenolpyruvate phosphonomutase-like protein [Talaromyces stipitatus ATCC 10500]
MLVTTGDLNNSKVQSLLVHHFRDLQCKGSADTSFVLDLTALRQPSITIFTAWDGDELLGCGALKELDATHGEIKSMRTAPEHTRKGVAKNIVHHIITEARRRNYTRLSLETGTASAFSDAQRLYQRLGFEECRPFCDYGKRIVLANIYDGASARIVASLPQSHVIATAIYTVAEAAGIKDETLSREELVRSTKAIAASIQNFNKALTVDIRDGYGKMLEITVKELIHAGVVGVNLEDFDNDAKKMYSKSEAADRIRTVLQLVKAAGVPDFVVNARCDTLVNNGESDEVIQRGKAYLQAGTTTVFVWGGSTRGGITRDEVFQLVKAFDGRLNVLLASKNGLSTKELATIGVSRISIGHTLQLAALEKIKEVAQSILSL